MRRQQSILCGNKLLDLTYPVVMGVINVTPDSFHSGSRYDTVDAALQQAVGMYEAGASIIDVGGMSSRPGAEIITMGKELDRVLPVIRKLHDELPEVILSIDTVHGEVAEACIQSGAHIINDISGASIDSRIVSIATKYKCPYVLMHMIGTPDNMQSLAEYDDVTMEVLAYMSNHIRSLRSVGIHDIIVDPGFGFAKMDTHNFQLMNQMSSLQMLDCPILVGVSRKSTIQRTLGVQAQDALNGTTALHMYLLERGANILRAHDVKEAVETVKLWKALQ